MATTVGSPEQAPLKETFSPRSSFIELVDYDARASAMDIHFKSGSVKRYLNCFPATFLSFKQSPTHDAYYSKLIKGRMASVTIKSANIGRQRSHPLKALTKRRSLNAGVKWIAGTVARAEL